MSAVFNNSFLRQQKLIQKFTFCIKGEETEPPHFVEVVKAATVEKGQPVFFECVVTGKPLPDVTWFLDGVELKESDIVKMIDDDKGKHFLEIKDTTNRRPGKVTCMAESPLGRDMCSAEMLFAEGKRNNKNCNPINHLFSIAIFY